MKRFEAQRSRGTTSFGFYLPETNRLTHNVRESRIKNLLKRNKGNNREVLFHHRFATSTPDVPNACHPFSTKNVWENNYIGVHNGIIWNDNKLEEMHSARGIEYVSKQPDGRFNDSEALIYDIASYLEGDVGKLTAEGSIAFVMIKRNADNNPVTLFFGRNNSNPLKMKRTKHSLTLSSEGDGTDIKPHTLYSYDYETGDITERYMYIPSSSWTQPKIDTGFSSGGSHTYMGYENGYKEDDFYEDDEFSRGWRDEFSKATAPSYNQKYKRAIDVIDNSDFNPRKGTESNIKGQLMQECWGDFNQAAIQALIEAEEAESEENRVNEAVYNSMNTELYNELSEYWYFCNSYKGMMLEIADNFEVTALGMKKRAKDIEKVKEALDKEKGVEQKDGSIVFPSGVKITKEEQSLLPYAAGLS